MRAVLTSPRITILVFFLLMLFCPAPAPGQSGVGLQRIVNNWPTIELYIAPTCDGQRIYLPDARYIHVTENGRPVNDVEVWCPDPWYRYPLDCAILLDLSPAFSAETLTNIKEHARELIAQLTDPLDRAMIIAVADTPTIVCSMTSDHAALAKAVDQITVASSSRVWDAIDTAVAVLWRERSSRPVVMYFGGRGDSGSLHTYSDCRNGVYGHFYACTYGVVGDTDSLAILAERTGGIRVHNPAVAWMSYIVQHAGLDVVGWETYCLVTYQARCMDGSTRVVEVSVVDTCGVVSTATKSFKAPRDTSTLVALPIRVDTVYGALESREAAVPVTLHAYPDPRQGNSIGSCTCTFLYDSTLLEFAGIDIPDGSILAAVPMEVAVGRGRVVIELQGSIQARPRTIPTVLLLLRFRVLAAREYGEIPTPVRLASWEFHEGCHRAWTSDGAVVIAQRRPRPLLDLAVNNSSVAWDSVTTQYAPSILRLTATVINHGSIPARNATAELSLPDVYITPVSPRATYARCAPADVAMGAASQAEWDLALFPRTVGDTITMTVHVRFDNADTLTGRLTLWIPAARTTTIEEAETLVSPQFYLYPNPCHGYTTLRFAGPTASPNVRIHDVLGRMIRTVTVTHSGNWVLDLSAVPAGMYIVEAGGFRQALLLTR